jgi:pentatricopeptide repeat protein
MTSDRSTLLNFLINSGRLGEAIKYLTQWLQKDLRPNVKALNFTINNVAKAGDIDALNSIGTHLNEVTSFIIIHNFFSL